jgi:hypothetical protein
MHSCKRAQLSNKGGKFAQRRVLLRAHAVQSPLFLGKCPEHAVETVQAIREAVAHSTCSPYSDLANEETLIINPPWSSEPRATVLTRHWLPYNI